MTNLNSTPSIEIKHGRMVDPANAIDATKNVYISDGRIAAVGQAPAGFRADQVLDASGLIVSPGLV
ncbi:MAG: dihydroorotase, partial [Burkholderiaceae bacterium]